MGKNKKKKKIYKDCWNLDFAFLKWLNERLPVYKKEASQFINLEYYTYIYNGEVKTQLQLLDRLIELTAKLVENDHYYDFEDSITEEVEEVLDIFKLIFTSLWW